MGFIYSNFFTQNWRCFWSFQPFEDFSYYDPKQKGSTSIKYGLPVLSDLKYDDLDIKNGVLVSLEYERVTYEDVEDPERLKIRRSLEKYCELDTLAEVEIVKSLCEIIKNEDWDIYWIEIINKLNEIVNSKKGDR